MNGEWIPQACTLPTAEQPVRVAEFGDLFRRDVLSVMRRSPTELEFAVVASAQSRVRELTERESECCSFFDFVVERTADAVRLLVRVPDAYADVLDGMQSRALAAVSARPPSQRK